MGDYLEMSDCTIEYEHYRHVFDEATLMRYGSPHFSDKEAGDALREIIRGHAEQASRPDPERLSQQAVSRLFEQTRMFDVDEPI